MARTESVGLINRILDLFQPAPQPVVSPLPKSTPKSTPAPTQKPTSSPTVQRTTTPTYTPVVQPPVRTTTVQSTGGSYPGGRTASQYLDAMQKGQVPWDDNLRARANNELQGSSGGNQAALNIPAFSFDYNQAEAEARAKLDPYYKQKLADAKGDVERAKRLIEEDYKIGARVRAEDLATQTEADTLKAEGETRDTRAALNSRGTLIGQIPMGATTNVAPESGYAGAFAMNPLRQGQAARRLAIERAIARQEEVAGLTRQRGIEEQDTQYKRNEQNILEEKEKRVQTEFVPAAYERAKEKYNQTYQQSMNNAVNRSLSANPYLQQLGWS